MSLLRVPAATMLLLVAVCIGFLVDAGVFLLLLLSSSDQAVTWWVTAVVLANLIPPILFAPVLGWLVDRVSGKGAWVAALLLSGVGVCAISLVESPVGLVALAALQAICAVVTSAASFKLLPLAQGLTEKTASSTAVALGSMAAIVGPPLAALLATGDMRIAFTLCGLLLIVAGGAVWIVAPSHVHVHVEHTAWHEVWIGTKSLRSMTLIRRFLPVIMGVVIVTSMEGVAGVFYLQEVAGSSLGYALILSAWAVGSFVGAVASGRKSFRLSPSTSIIVGGLTISAALLFEGLVPFALLIGVAFVGGGFGNAIHNVGVRNLVYEAVPSSQQGQVWSVVGAMFSSAAALGNFLGTPGIIADARTTIIIAGAIGVALALTTLMATTTWRSEAKKQPVKS